MKIGVISDTHIPDSAKEIPQEILNEFKNVDMIIHAGDLVELAVLNNLRVACPNVKAVWGNMDPEEVRNKLPKKEVFKVGNFNIGVMHGWGSPNNLVDLLLPNFKDDHVQIVVFGHSHCQFNEIKNGILFFNPGSPTDKEFSPYNSYGILEINDKIKPMIIKI